MTSHSTPDSASSLGASNAFGRHLPGAGAFVIDEIWWDADVRLRLVDDGGHGCLFRC
jgi:hypothetical protein